MNTTKQSLRMSLIVSLVVVISIMHYAALDAHMELHILHRELYFIPILLASFWFGLRAGVVTALMVSLIYAPYTFLRDDPHSTLLAVTAQVLVFILIAFGLGWLVERQKRQQQEVLEAENLSVLGRAAISVGQEMKDLLGALKAIVKKAEERERTELSENFEQEMSRLDQMSRFYLRLPPQNRCRCSLAI